LVQEIPVLKFPVLRLWSIAMPRSCTPSIVPNGHDQNFYLVINNYGKFGPAFETDVGEAEPPSAI
jgi:hypothetical protein